MSSDVVQRHSAEEAFSLLGSPIRVDILRALAETPHDPVGFAELRKRVGEADSGKFNYHLGKLTDAFVRRAGADADGDGDSVDGRGNPERGYELTMAGRQVVGAILAGTYTDDVTMAPVPVGSACPLCGAELAAAYEDEHAVVRCPGCGGFENRHGFPPGTVGQFERAELPAAFDRWLRTAFGRIVAGFCTTCSGRLDARLLTAADDPGDHDHLGEVRAVYTCERCGSEARSSAFLPLLYHPTATAFFYDHGVDVTTAPTWEVTADVDDWTTELVGTDPPSVRVTVPFDDEELVVDVDGSVTITDVERRPR